MIMENQKRFEGKVALITGGGAGIGEATALQLAKEGAAVGVADIIEERAKGVSKAILDKGGRAIAIVADAAAPEGCERMVAETVNAFGRLDILITSAGIHGGGQTVVDTTLEIWNKVHDLDLRGAFVVSKHAVLEMHKAGSGAIVHVSSINGLVGHANGTAFSAAKGGLINLTRHMAVAHAQENIRVNCVCPGVIHTPLTEKWLSDPETNKRVCKAHPMNRIGTAEEVASTIAFLVSSEAAFITGAILPVDGGYMAAGRSWSP
jgi:NAD(P)-dependent dehydrogenase (short-subunit alcohol dehydrogenase family)